MEMLAMREQFERDQIMLEQYASASLLIFVLVQELTRSDRVKALEGELQGVNVVAGGQMAATDELIKQLQEQVTLWRNKYDAPAKPYSQLRTEHLECTSSSHSKPARPRRPSTRWSA